MYNISITWYGHHTHSAIDFNVNASEVWHDSQSVVFRGWGTRASVASECVRLVVEHPDCMVRAFWTPDGLNSLLEWLGLWRVSAWIWELCEEYLCVYQ